MDLSVVVIRVQVDRYHQVRVVSAVSQIATIVPLTTKKDIAIVQRMQITRLGRK